MPQFQDQTRLQDLNAAQCGMTMWTHMSQPGFVDDYRLLGMSTL